MKKQIIFILIIILIKIFIPIKPYIEVNNINIITKIDLTCSDKYILKYTETIPERDDNGIEYKYKTYKVEDNDLNDAIKSIEKNKNIFKSKAKIITHNCNNKIKEDLIS